MSEYTPSVEERRQGAKAIEAALNQCGIAVRYAISGPSELFDVASVLLKSDFMAAHDRDVATAERERVLAEVREGIIALTTDWVVEDVAALVDVLDRSAVPVEPQQCGDYPAPCNCDDPTTHGGH